MPQVLHLPNPPVNSPPSFSPMPVRIPEPIPAPMPIPAPIPIPDVEPFPADPSTQARSPQSLQGLSPRIRPSKPPIRRPPVRQSLHSLQACSELVSVHELQSEHPVTPLVSHPRSKRNEIHPVFIVVAKIRATEHKIERIFVSSFDFLGLFGVLESAWLCRFNKNPSACD